jgi:hypothetical protein
LIGLGIFFGTIGAKLSYHLYVKFEMLSVLTDSYVLNYVRGSLCGISPAFDKAIFVRIGPMISKKIQVAVIVVSTVVPIFTA